MSCAVSFNLIARDLRAHLDVPGLADGSRLPIRTACRCGTASYYRSWFWYGGRHVTGRRCQKHAQQPVAWPLTCYFTGAPGRIRAATRC